MIFLVINSCLQVRDEILFPYIHIWKTKLSNTYDSRVLAIMLKWWKSKKYTFCCETAVLWFHYDFRIKTMFVSSLPPDACIIYVICVCLRLVRHILCWDFFCFLFYLSSSCVLCSQCCQFLWIVHSWLSLQFSLTFIYSLILNKRLSITVKLWKLSILTRSSYLMIQTQSEVTEIKTLWTIYHRPICVIDKHLHLIKCLALQSLSSNLWPWRCMYLSVILILRHR